MRRLACAVLAVALAACSSADTSRLPTVPTLDETGADGFASVSAGLDHTCALTVAGRAYCWGIGRATVNSDTRHPRPATPRRRRLLAVRRARSDLAHVSLDQRGRGAYLRRRRRLPPPTAGENNASGAVGVAAADAPVPEPVLGGLTFKSISAGFSHTCAIGTNGIAYCWGDNDRGQLGTGDIVPRSAPTPVAAGAQFVQISAGEARTCGVTGGQRRALLGQHLGCIASQRTRVCARATPARSGAGRSRAAGAQRGLVHDVRRAAIRRRTAGRPTRTARWVMGPPRAASLPSP